MTRTARILAVTAGLMVAGALFGGIAAAVALFVSLAITEGLGSALEPAQLGFAALLGAAIGAIAAPAAGWLLLRHVPLGVAVAGTVAGAIAGGIAGWVTHTEPISLAFVGFAVAALVLRLRASRSSKKTQPVDTDAS